MLAPDNETAVGRIVGERFNQYVGKPVRGKIGDDGCGDLGHCRVVALVFTEIDRADRDKRRGAVVAILVDMVLQNHRVSAVWTIAS